MIVNQSIGSRFDKLGEYLEHGDKARGNYVEDPEERVEWVEARNLLFEDRKAVVKTMQMTAARNDRVEKPALHLIVSWQAGNTEKGIPPDNPTREEMLAAAEHLLESVDLDEHQAWIVSHKDGGAPHLHIMVNKIHPETKRCWDNSYSQARLWDAHRQLEKEYGWHKAGPDRLDTLWKGSRIRETYWERNYKELGRGAPFSKAIRRYCLEDFEEARSWPDLVERLKKNSVHLEPRGRGMVAVNIDNYIALSRIRPDLSRPKLERRFGMTWESYRDLKEQGLSIDEIEAQADPPSKTDAPSQKEGHGVETQKEEGRKASLETNAESADSSENVEEGVVGRDEQTPSDLQAPVVDPFEKSASIGEDGGLVYADSLHDGAPYVPSASGASTAAGEAPGSLASYEHPSSDDPLETGTAATNQPITTDSKAMNEEPYSTPPIEGKDREVAEALSFAKEFYREQYAQLPEDHPAREYFQSRILEGEGQGAFIKEAEVGYAPDDWNALTGAAEEAGIDMNALEEAGLVVERRDGKGYFDRFRGRVTFPMNDFEGQVRGFGARRVDGLERETPTLDGNPKYINSREGGIFDKQEVLFGASRMRGSEGPVFVTEGYIDALQMQRAGYRAVALSGTRMSLSQARQVSAMLGPGQRPIVLLDGDEAGRQSAEDVVSYLIEAGEVPEVVDLPDGYDADEYLRENGAEGLTHYMGERGQQWPQFIFNRHLAESQWDSPETRAEGYKKVLDYASRAPDEYTRERLFVSAAEFYIDGPLPEQQVDPDYMSQRGFETIRAEFESLLESKEIPVRPWGEVSSDYPDLRKGTPERSSDNPMVDDPGSVHEVAAPSSMASMEAGEAPAETPLQALNSALENMSEVDVSSADLAWEWENLREMAESETEQYEQLQLAWEEGVKASFADPEQAMKAYNKNRLYHTPERARLAVIYPDAHQTGFANPGAYHEMIDVPNQQQALLRVHEKLNRQETILTLTREYAKDLAQSFHEVNERAQLQNERHELPPSQQPTGSEGPEAQEAETQDAETQASEMETSATAANNDEQRPPNNPSESNERAREAAHPDRPPARSGNDRASSGEQPPTSPARNGERSGSGEPGEPDRGDASRGGVDRGREGRGAGDGEPSGQDSPRRERGSRDGAASGGPANDAGGDAERVEDAPGERAGDAGGNQRGGDGRVATPGPDGEAAGRSAGAASYASAEDHQEFGGAGGPAPRGPEDLEGEHRNNGSAERAAGQGDERPRTGEHEGNPQADANRDEGVGEGAGQPDIEREGELSHRDGEHGIDAQGDRRTGAPEAGHEDRRDAPNQESNEAVQRGAGEARQDISEEGAASADRVRSTDVGSGYDRGADRGVDAPLIKELSDEELRETYEAIENEATSRVGELDTLGPELDSKVDPRPGNAAYQLNGQENIEGFFERLEADFRKGYEEETTRQAQQSLSSVEKAAEQAQARPQDSERWGDLRAKVEQEVQRRYNVQRAEQVYERIDQANQIRHYKNIEQEMRGLFDQPNLAKYEKQVDTTRQALESKMGAMYANPQEATSRFMDACQEEGFTDAIRTLAQTPSHFGKVRSDQNEQWRVRQDFAKNVESSGQALTRYDAGQLGRAAARHDLAVGLHAEMKVRHGQTISEKDRKHAAGVIRGMQDEFNRVRYKVIYNPDPSQLDKEAQHMIQNSSEATKNHLISLSEGVQERMKINQSAKDALELNNRVDNTFRQLYSNPQDARIRFENEAFPNGMKGNTEDFQKAMVRIMHNPSSFGTLRDGVSKEQGQKLAKNVCESYAKYVGKVGELRGALKLPGQGDGKGVGTKDLTNQIAKTAGKGALPGRAAHLARSMGRTVANRFKETAGHDRF